MLSYKSLFALLVVIGMATALPIGGGGSGLPDSSEVSAEIQASVLGASSQVDLAGNLPDFTAPLTINFLFPNNPSV